MMSDDVKEDLINDVKEDLIRSQPMAQRTKAQQTFIKRLNELLPRGEATVVARQTGIHISTISNWRKGKVAINPSLEMLEKLAEAFDVPVAYLITDVPLILASRFPLCMKRALPPMKVSSASTMPENLSKPPRCMARRIRCIMNHADFCVMPSARCSS